MGIMRAAVQVRPRRPARAPASSTGRGSRLDDEVGAIRARWSTTPSSGPLNVTGPAPGDQRRVHQGRSPAAVHRPAPWIVPGVRDARRPRRVRRRGRAGQPARAAGVLEREGYTVPPRDRRTPRCPRCWTADPVTDPSCPTPSTSWSSVPGSPGCAPRGRWRGADRSVVVCEAADGVGGRVRTDVVDGFLVDRGFQILNTSYPALRAAVDLDALDLRRVRARGRGARRRRPAAPPRRPAPPPLLGPADRARRAARAARQGSGSRRAPLRCAARAARTPGPRAGALRRRGPRAVRASAAPRRGPVPAAVPVRRARRRATSRRRRGWSSAVLAQLRARRPDAALARHRRGARPPRGAPAGRDGAPRHARRAAFAPRARRGTTDARDRPRGRGDRRHRGHRRRRAARRPRRRAAAVRADHATTTSPTRRRPARRCCTSTAPAGRWSTPWCSPPRRPPTPPTTATSSSPPSSAPSRCPSRACAPSWSGSGASATAPGSTWRRCRIPHALPAALPPTPPRLRRPVDLGDGPVRGGRPPRHPVGAGRAGERAADRAGGAGAARLS